MWFLLNGKRTEIPPGFADAALLWLLRDRFELHGAKYGCGVGSCGACTVHVEGEAALSCLLTARDVQGKRVVTLEGLGEGRPNGLHPVQRAWIEESVPQCGYCQSGQIMTAAALLAKNPNPDAEVVAEIMDPVICRCGTHGRIRAAIDRAGKLLKGGA
jgi:aerobic-type carbon monoxide dehydrogenase small subunit (CoxS/CutS family)